MSYVTYIATVSELESGTAESWVAGSEAELMEMLEGSSGIDGNRGLYAAQAYCLVDTLRESGCPEDDYFDGYTYDLGEFEDERFIVSFAKIK